MQNTSSTRPPRSASRSAHRSSTCQYRRIWEPFSRSASRSGQVSSICRCRTFWKSPLEVLTGHSQAPPRSLDYRGRGRPDAGDDDTSLPPPDEVAGALAWLSSRPARSEQPVLRFTNHSYRLRCAYGAWLLGLRTLCPGLSPEQDVKRLSFFP